MKELKKFEIFEGNGGNLYLVTSGEDGQPDYFADCYDDYPEHIWEDWKILRDGGDPIRDGWDNGTENPAEAYERLMYYFCEVGGVRFVADNDGVYLEYAREAAQRELCK